MAEPVALTALMLDAAIGWPAPLYRCLGHPVGGFARAIGWCETRWNRPGSGEWRRRIAGTATMAALVGGTAALAWLAERVAGQVGRGGWLIVAALAFPALAQRSLDDHLRPVAAALERGDLAGGRRAVSRIVGRDTEGLDHAGVARAAIESLAESFCDGVVAPLFWLLLLGLPGIWAYKAANTADSLVGHREPRWRAFGWAAARTDDLLNLVPARLAAALLCLAGGRGWRITWRDAGNHASPNAGWPEAAMAGALGLRLAGRIAYDGVTSHKPWIGEGRAEADAADIRRALALYRRGCLILWLSAGGIAWLR